VTQVIYATRHGHKSANVFIIGKTTFVSIRSSQHSQET